MHRSLNKPLLGILAVLFGAAAILYSGLWIYSATRGIPVELGFDNKYLPTERAELVQSVQPGSPAEHAGLRAGDRIIAINGAPLQAEDSITAVWSVHKPGDVVELTVQRPGVTQPVVLHAVFRASGPQSAEAGFAQHLGRDINSLFPIAFLTVALAVLFLRVDDRNAWLVACMFCGFIAIPGFANTLLLLPAPLRPFVLSYHALFNNLFAPLFYFFFAVFPSPSPLERRLPWLKWFAVAVGAVLAFPGARWEPGSAATLTWLAHGLGHWLILLFNYGLLGLGFLSLIWNAATVTSSEAQRKIRVILWGALVGVVPATLVLAASDFFEFHITLPVGATVIVLLWLFPLSFAYAVVKHRVLEIPVLLRRSARYLLVQRGFVLLLIALSAGVTVIFAVFFARYLQRMTEAALPGAIGLGTVFGTVLFWTGTRVHRDVGRQIDRAFFRNAYDARRVLEDLVEKARTVTDRTELAALLERHLREALRPSSLAIYFETADGQLCADTGDVPAELQTISPLDPALRGLAVEGKPRDSFDNGLQPETLPLALLHPDCLVPILGRDGRLTGLVVLGMRLSEEPYSREDKQLLAAAANQAGGALESIRLGEKIAERIEVERRAAQEMEFARQVQTRLFPQELPTMKRLEYTGACIPARTVGGDYYDFLELRPGRLGLVLADIAGKGVPGALLMANLQANLRSQYALAVDDLPRLLSSVNRLFYQSTDHSSYATMLFADYDDTTRSLRYVNCGHLPPLLLRANCSGSQAQKTCKVERLSPTTTVLGLFEEWKCEIAEVNLAPGDLLVLYTDGVTEATNADGDEFGEARLINVLASDSNLGTAQILESVVAAVRSFSPGEQQDDITLVIARCIG